MKTIFLFILLGLTSITMAQKTEKFQTVKIKTSAICGECKERIENKLNYSKGIKFADLDLDTKVVTVKYKTSLISAKEVKNLIASIGYHAGDVERDKAAFDKLPGCCQDPDAKCSK